MKRFLLILPFLLLGSPSLHAEGICTYGFQLLGFYSKEEAPPRPEPGESVVRLELGGTVYHVSGTKGILQLVALLGMGAFAKGCVWDPVVGNEPAKWQPGEAVNTWDAMIELLKKICPWTQRREPPAENGNPNRPTQGDLKEPQAH